ncbi:MAG: tRNA (adenine(58)-N(1))-methyltransferase, partial [uncultured Frankineae bacterium]
DPRSTGRQPAGRRRAPPRPAAARRPGAADRPQGPDAHDHPGAGAPVPHPQGHPRARHAHRRSRGRGRDDRRHRLPRAATAAVGLRAVDAARSAGRLPQGRRPDRADGRRLPRRARRRGRGRLGRAVAEPAACGGGGRPAVVVRAPRRLRRDRPRERRALLRRTAPGVEHHGRRPGPSARRERHRHRRRPRGPGHARALGGARRRLARPAPGRAGLLLRRDHHPAVDHGRGPARARHVHRAAVLGVARARLARRGAGRAAGAPDDRPHRVPVHRPADGRRGRPAGAPAAAEQGGVRRAGRRRAGRRRPGRAHGAVPARPAL